MTVRQVLYLEANFHDYRNTQESIEVLANISHCGSLVNYPWSFILDSLILRYSIDLAGVCLGNCREDCEEKIEFFTPHFFGKWVTFRSVVS